MLIDPKPALEPISNQYGWARFVRLLYLRNIGDNIEKRLIHLALFHQYAKSNFIDEMSEQDKEDLRNRKAILLLDFQIEYDNQSTALFDFLHTQFNNNNIPPDCVIVLTGNKLLVEAYEGKKQQVHTPFHIMYSNIHISGVWNLLNEKEKSDDIFNFLDEDYEYNLFNSETFYPYDKYKTSPEEAYNYKKENLDKIKTFLLHQRSPHLHRDLLTNLLQNQVNTWENNYCSYVSNYSVPKHNQDLLMELMESRASGNLLDTLDSSYKFLVDVRTRRNCFFEIVSETGVGDDYLGLTEKPFWATMNSLPIVILGPKNSLQLFRDFGFQSFDKYIDESYDNLSGDERTHAVYNLIRQLEAISQVEKLELYESMRPVLEHNYEMTKEHSLISKENRYLESLLNEFSDILRRI